MFTFRTKIISGIFSACFIGTMMSMANDKKLAKKAVHVKNFNRYNEMLDPNYRYKSVRVGQIDEDDLGN